MQGVKLLQGDVWGYRKDLDEYFNVEDATIEEIRPMANGGMSMHYVASNVQQKILSPDLISTSPAPR